MYHIYPRLVPKLQMYDFCSYFYIVIVIEVFRFFEKKMKHTVTIKMSADNVSMAKMNFEYGFGIGKGGYR